MARARKSAALAAIAQTAATEAPANAGASAPNLDQSQTAAANETVQMPGAAPAVVVGPTDPVTPPATEQPETKPLDGLISVRSHKSRRRAGLAFGPEAVTIDTAELTDEQLEAITGDPLLEVTEAE